MNSSVLQYLRHTSKFALWATSVALSLVLTEAIVVVMQLTLLGVVTADYLITGFVASALVASLIVWLIFNFLGQVGRMDRDNVHLSAIINASPVPMAVADGGIHVVMLNPEFVRVFGYTLQDVPTLTAWWPKAFPEPDYRQWVVATWHQRLASASTGESPCEPLEVRICCKDGSTKVVLVSASPLDMQAETSHVILLQDVTERVNNMRALDESRSVLQSVIETIPMRVFWKNRESSYLGCNTAFARDAGQESPDDIVGKTDDQLSWNASAERLTLEDREVMESGQPRLEVEEPLVLQNDQVVWLRKSKVPLHNPLAGSVGLVGVYEDITERKAAEADLRIAATAFESQEGIVIVAASGTILRVNKAFTRITGFPAHEAVGKTLSLLKSGLHGAGFYSSMWQRIRRDGHWEGEIQNRRKSGETYTQWLTITAVSANGGEVTHYVGTMLDITDRKNMERQVHHLAHHDALTDLPNRVLLTDRLNQALAQARREKAMVGLLYLDLDRFKPVNDMLGHEVGDRLLTQVAGRLRNCVSRTTDTVSRIGGDEFVVLLAHLEKASDAVAVAQRILDALNQAFVVDPHTIEISTSIGIALYPEHGVDAMALMKHADQAMYQAKGLGGSRCLYEATVPH